MCIGFCQLSITALMIRLSYVVISLVLSELSCREFGGWDQPGSSRLGLEFILQKRDGWTIPINNKRGVVISTAFHFVLVIFRFVNMTIFKVEKFWFRCMVYVQIFVLGSFTYFQSVFWKNGSFLLFLSEKRCETKPSTRIKLKWTDYRSWTYH